jgi:protein-tyrosine phosphatase
MKRFNKDSYLYDWISCVIPNRIYFGPIPNQYMIQQLVKNKFDLIVNLTDQTYEQTYEQTYKHINYPIIDKSVPSNVLEYCKFILLLKRHYEDDNKIYIHCLAGHSRSSLVIVSLLFCIYNEELKYIINKVIQYHRNRVVLRNIWQVRSPFNYKQFSFLCTIHKNIYINVHTDSKMYNWLSPKNIKIHTHSLDDVLDYFYPLDKLTDVIQKNDCLMTKLKHTYLKKIIFISDNKEKAIFYNNFFKDMRETCLR